MIDLELSQLDLRYASLRISDPVRRARLEQALAQQGQQVPVLVVPTEGHRFVLIEGYGLRRSPEVTRVRSPEVVHRMA
jgi:hypothetical protein